jgi:hypothetical protein
MDDYTAVMVASFIVLIALLVVYLTVLKKALELEKKI